MMKKIIWLFLCLLVIFTLYEVLSITKFSKYRTFAKSLISVDSLSIDSVFSVNREISGNFLDSLPTAPSFYFGNKLNITNPISTKYYRFWNFYKRSKGTKYFDITFWSEKDSGKIIFSF